MAHMGNDFRHVEHHRARIAALHLLPIHFQQHVERLRIPDLVGRDEPRADRPGRIEALALVPLRSRHLEAALRDVVDDAIARDMRERRGVIDITRLRTDYDTELY